MMLTAGSFVEPLAGPSNLPSRHAPGERRRIQYVVTVIVVAADVTGAAATADAAFYQWVAHFFCVKA